MQQINKAHNSQLSTMPQAPFAIMKAAESINCTPAPNAKRKPETGLKNRFTIVPAKKRKTQGRRIG